MYPRFSLLPNAPLVFHDQPLCTLGNNIERQHLGYGSDGRRRCKECEDIGLRLGTLIETADERLARMSRLGIGSAAYAYEMADPVGGIGARYGLTAERVYGLGIGEPSYSPDPLADLFSPKIGAR